MNKEIGSCCSDLKEAMSEPNSFFLMGENGVFYMTISYVDTEDGPAFMDQALIFCPFCGTQVQSKEQIAQKA